MHKTRWNNGRCCKVVELGSFAKAAEETQPQPVIRQL
jgi:hypothetical protein